NDDLIPHLKGLKSASNPTARRKVISEIMSGVDRTRIDTERNLLDVLDKIDDLTNESVDRTHVFTLSQVYEGLLLQMGEKNKEGRDAQTDFDYKTGATQVLFLQHVMRALKHGGRCGIVVDEGLLFRQLYTH